MRKYFQKAIWIVSGMSIFFITMPGLSLAGQEVAIAIVDSGATRHVDGAQSFTSYPASTDPLGHGTETARLIREGNPSAKIYMLQVCENIDGTLKPSRDAVLKAIQWCIDHNIRLVNMSLVTRYDKDIEDAITYAATSHGIIFIAAGGNKTLASHFATDAQGYVCKVSKVTKPAFPASSPHVISVGAVDSDGQIARYSDHACDIYADGKIRGQEGTSFACARITAKVARFLQDPAHVSTDKKYILSHLEL